MKLVGKRLVRKTHVPETRNELIVNPINGKIKVTNPVMIALNLAGNKIGFGYDDDKRKVYIYLTEEGIKVNGKGEFTSRYHARELAARFGSHFEGVFHLDVNILGTSVEGTEGTFYEITGVDGLKTPSTLVSAEAKGLASEVVNQSLQVD